MALAIEAQSPAVKLAAELFPFTSTAAGSAAALSPLCAAQLFLVGATIILKMVYCPPASVEQRRAKRARHQAHLKFGKRLNLPAHHSCCFL